MKTKIRCQNAKCGKSVTITEELFGKYVKCPGCGQVQFALSPNPTSVSWSGLTGPDTNTFAGDLSFPHLRPDAEFGTLQGPSFFGINLGESLTITPSTLSGLLTLPDIKVAFSDESIKGLAPEQVYQLTRSPFFKGETWGQRCARLGFEANSLGRLAYAMVDPSWIIELTAAFVRRLGGVRNEALDKEPFYKLAISDDVRNAFLEIPDVKQGISN